MREECADREVVESDGEGEGEGEESEGELEGEGEGEEEDEVEVKSRKKKKKKEAERKCSSCCERRWRERGVAYIRPKRHMTLYGMVEYNYVITGGKEILLKAV